MARSEQEALNGILILIKQGKVDQRIYDVTREIIAQNKIPYGNDMEELEAIYKFVQGRVRYMRDPVGRDVYQSAIETLDKQKMGDCEDLTILISSMVMSIGYPVALKLASIEGDIWDHIYSLAGLPPKNPTEWVAMDGTLLQGRLGQQPERKRDKTFRITNGLTSSEGEVYQPPSEWKGKILKYVPLAIMLPVVFLMFQQRKARR